MAKKQKKVGIDQIHMQNAIKTLAANIRFASVDDPIRSDNLSPAFCKQQGCAV